MEAKTEKPVDEADEVKRLQNCINDLISVLALPAIWSGNESSQIVGTLLDVLLGMLRLDFAYARLNDSSDGSPIEVVRLSERKCPSTEPQEVGRALDRWLSGDPSNSSFVIPNPAGEGEVSIAWFSLGLKGEVGTLVAGSRRADFPTEVERLLLRVAANQAGIGLQEAQRSSEQKRIAEVLEERVAERTKRLTAVNEELRRSEAYLAEAQRLSHTGSFGWRVATGEIVWSEETYRIFQYDRTTTAIVESVLQRVHPEDAAFVKETIERAAQDGKDFNIEHRLLMPDSAVKHVHVVAHGERDESGALEFLGALMDVTAAKQAAEALRHAEADLAHMSRVTTMGELVASIAHEVNQPLGSIVTNGHACVRLLSAEVPNVERSREVVGRMITDGMRASEVIKRIRDALHKTPSEKAPVSINETIQEVMALVNSELLRSKTELQVELAADLPAVLGDRIQLQQVILNLILNAKDAMSDVANPRELQITSGKNGAGEVLVTVRDTGRGLDPDHIDRIFDPFFTTKTEGMGLGLSISRTIIEAHGGTLWATQNQDKGATVQFTVPAVVTLDQSKSDLFPDQTSSASL
jgi:C4-dicarboxylate-specific signal transduction histidine kinase